MKQLIVTADDFGLSLEVNEAVERAHREGILTAASLMVSGAAAADAVARARRLPDLKVGLHVALTNAFPTLPPERIPGLVRPDGSFHDAMVRTGVALAASPALRRQLAEEVAAQFAAFRATGLPFDHVNAHRHFHVHPIIAAALFDQARRHGVPATRVPFEPVALVRGVDPAGRTWASRLFVPLAARLRRQAARFGLVAADRVIGLAWSGAFTRERLEGVLERLPEGSTELYFHPATQGSFSGAANGYRYVDELAALTAPSVQALAAAPDLRRTGYAALAV